MRWLTAVVAVAALACGGDAGTGPEQEVQLDEEFELRLGESAMVESTGLRITFAHVLEDSRCPPEAYCFWIGNAKVSLDIAQANEPAELFEACTFEGICPGVLEFGAYEVALLAVKPASMPRSALEYRVTLRVFAK
ncbi:MAG TPA: hypothetical protein VLC48_01090 [Gemmatimonadota bacterium]|nr:hypothetical protein [Gemmatimonadota bacterium]